MFINHSSKQVTAKIVYYGPGLSGKTTNLQYIFSITNPKSRGELVSIETDIERTLFFDLLPINVGLVNGYQTKFQLYTVPGQVFYDSTRRLVLKGADGIVFVADSQELMDEPNKDSFENLKVNLASQNQNIKEIPLVFQFNKRDLKNIFPIESMNKKLNTQGCPYYGATAIKGTGVIETLREISSLTLIQIKKLMEHTIQDGRPKTHVNFDTNKKHKIIKKEELPFKKIPVEKAEEIPNKIEQQLKVSVAAPKTEDVFELQGFEDIEEIEELKGFDDIEDIDNVPEPEPVEELEEIHVPEHNEALEENTPELRDETEELDIPQDETEELDKPFDVYKEEETKELFLKESLADPDTDFEFQPELAAEPEAALIPQPPPAPTPQARPAPKQEAKPEPKPAPPPKIHATIQPTPPPTAQPSAPPSPPQPVQQPKVEPEQKKETKPKKSMKPNALDILEQLKDESRITVIKKIKKLSPENSPMVIEVKDKNSILVEPIEVKIKPGVKKITIILDVQK